MSVSSENLIWIDLEMTGLDSQNDVIIEIATVVTDRLLNVVAEGPVLAIHQPDEIMAGMDEWNQRQHTRSGLIKRVKESQVNVDQAALWTLDFLRNHVPPGVSPMCGNSICQDRRFLARLMPELERFFHYRNLDVSTLKELAKRWYPKVAKGCVKVSQHLALADIHDSIQELRYYQEKLLLPLE